MAIQPSPDTIEGPPPDGTDLFAEVGERFIEPEVARRRAGDTFGADDRVYRYQVMLPLGKPAVIRLNEKVRGSVLAQVGRELQVGERRI